jgi:hypothetical protein
MPYSQFTTITKVKEAFNLTTIEGIRFFPEIASIQPSNTLATTLEETLPLAVATGSEKARSELIISPVLVETRRILNRKISLNIYPLPPVEQILGFLVWMIQLED